MYGAWVIASSRLPHLRFYNVLPCGISDIGGRVGPAILLRNFDNENFVVNTLLPQAGRKAHVALRAFSVEIARGASQ